MRHISAVILCGGAGERLQGVDKPLRPLLGRPLIERVLERVRPQADEAIIVANRSPGEYARYARVVDDGAYRGRGPLAGIAAGLAAAAAEWVLCVPGDAPLLPGDLAERLDSALTRVGADVALVHDGRGRQPLCSLIPRRLRPELRRYLDEGGTAPREWLKSYRVAEADYAEWPLWGWSVNTPEEWALIEHHIGERETGSDA
ncbi:MAG: molybdenum cofactor guanylyltransferase MobA [Nevskia sp.]|nr:molybdenum cofactor guanylyltransferase MobA [Nevskia sp.]